MSPRSTARPWRLVTRHLRRCPASQVYPGARGSQVHAQVGASVTGWRAHCGGYGSERVIAAETEIELDAGHGGRSRRSRRTVTAVTAVTADGVRADGVVACGAWPWPLSRPLVHRRRAAPRVAHRLRLGRIRRALTRARGGRR